MSVPYHPDKGNVVADALSQFSMGSVSLVEESKRNLVKDVHRLVGLVVRINDSPNGGMVVHHNSELSLVVEVKSKQHKESILGKMNESFSQGGMMFLGMKEKCMCVMWMI